MYKLNKKCIDCSDIRDYPIYDCEIIKSQLEEQNNYNEYIKNNQINWKNVKILMNHFSESYKNNNSVFLSDLWIDEKIDNEIYYDVKYFTLSCQEKNIYYTFNGEQCQHLLENFRIPMRKADSWLFEANNNWNYIIYIYTNENIYRISGYPKSEEDEIFEIIPIF